MKKHGVWTIAVAVLAMFYVVLIHVSVPSNDEKGHLSTVYLLLHFGGVIACGMMAVPIMVNVQEKAWEWFWKKYGNGQPFFYLFAYFLYILLFGLRGTRLSGVVLLVILIVIGFGPTMTGILIGNLILGAGWSFAIAV